MKVWPRSLILSGRKTPFALFVLYASSVFGQSSLLIENVTVISAEQPGVKADTSVLVQNGIISRIGRVADMPEVAEPDLQRLDGGGQFLIPGLIDSHVHLGGQAGLEGAETAKKSRLIDEFHQAEPRSFLAFGFTTLIDVSATPARVDAWNRLTTRPDLHYCISMPFANGYGMAFAPEDTRFDTPYFLYDEKQANQIPEKHVLSDHTAEAVIEKISQTDAICAKVYYETGFGGLFDFPVPSVQLIRDVVTHAQNAGLVTLLHGNSLEAQRFAVQSRVDVLAHGLWHWTGYNGEAGIPDAIRQVLDDVVEADIAYQPTLQVLFGERDIFLPEFLDDIRLEEVYSSELIDWYKSQEGGWFRRRLKKNYVNNPKLVEAFIGAEQETDSRDTMLPSEAGIDRLGRVVTYLHDNGGRFAFGTDTPSSPTYANPPGYNGLMEIRRLASFGVSPESIFAALTIENARVFGIDDTVGSVEVGKVANLLITGSNPMVSIEAYDDIEWVIQRGEAYRRSSLVQIEE